MSEVIPQLLSDNDCWELVLGRNRLADGLFWYSVSTTSIYCRPSCPSRRPARAHVRFHVSPAAAEQAGFRSCLRCSPDQIDRTVRMVAQVRALLDAAEGPLSLNDLAAQTGWSGAHLQRIFKREVGLSPKQYFLIRRDERFRTELKTGQTVTASLYAAGHASPASVYAPATDQLGMSPRTYQQGGTGEHIRYALADTPVGSVLVAATARGLCSVQWGTPDTALSALLDEYPNAQLREDLPAVAPYLLALLDHLHHGTPPLALTTDVHGTAFQQQVWKALQQIPWGETRTYAEIACALGQPSAVRAVARACAANRLALLIPCHRVLPKKGGNGGYRWGTEQKTRLIAHERSAVREGAGHPEPSIHQGPASLGESSVFDSGY
ncbi:bifunctional transcriptional activator/DNA repair enzyme AdaA [Deinococcus oregonensis]|uniref:Bifunctional transcriptional activator/DNA repair enzyme AdaA n=1 Tax=Deinococcus oregonensis TaxID=1805970 RepID=A0ABV6AW56_9DEIO